MAVDLGSVALKVTPDMKGFAPELDKGISQSMKRVGGSMQKVGAIATGVITAPILAGFSKMTNAASDLGESINATNVVFGKASGKISEFASRAAKDAGLSKRAFNELVTPIGAMLQNVGFGADEAAESSINLAQRAADMASVFNVDVSEALGAIQAGLRGEADPLERFGVGLSDAAVTAHALEMGLAGTADELDANAKTQARLSLLMKQTDSIAGDFANTSDQVANAERIAAAEAENLAAKFGQKLLPIKAKVIAAASRLLDWFNKLSPAGETLAMVIAGLAAAVGPLLVVAGTLIKSLATIGPVLAGISLPVVAVVAGIAALTAGLVYAYKNSEAFRRVIANVGAAVKGLFDLLVRGDFTGALRDAFGWEEDAPMVASLLGIRDAVTSTVKAITAAIKLMTTGDFTSAIGRALGVSEDSPLVDRLLTLRETVASAFQSILAAGQALWKGIQAAIGIVVAAFTTASGSGAQTGSRLVGVFTSIYDVAKVMFGALAKVIATVTKITAAIWARWGGDILKFAKSTFDNIMRLVNAALRVVKGVIDVFLGVLTGDWRRAWGGIRNIVGGVWEAIKALLRQALNGITLALRMALSAISALWRRGWDAVKNYAARSFVQIVAAVMQMRGRLLTFFRELPGKILDRLRRLPGQLFRFGADMLKQFRDGIKSIDLWAGIKSIFNKLPGFVKKILGISSPSKIFFDIGRNITLGLIEGIKRDESAIKKAAQSMVNAAGATAHDGPRGGGLAATRGLNPEFLRRFNAYNAELGGMLRIISGYRSSAQQAELYRRYLAGTGNLAAPPGRSNHERGLAIDHAPRSTPAMRAIARKHRLHYPVRSEMWHVEPFAEGGFFKRAALLAENPHSKGEFVAPYEMLRNAMAESIGEAGGARTVNIMPGATNNWASDLDVDRAMRAFEFQVQSSSLG